MEDSELNLLLKDYSTTASTVSLSTYTVATGIREVNSIAPRNRKVLEGNRIVIYRDGIKYNTMGSME